MRGFNSLVLEEHRHLKWRALDPLEQVLMILCGVAITGFSVLVMCDIITRTIGHPWLWLQEATMTFFIYVAATCDISLAMALLVLLVRRRGTLDVAAGQELKG